MKIDYDTLFFFVDDCKDFEPWYKKHLVSDGLVRRDRPCRLRLSEILTILIAYHQSGMSRFKYCYLDLYGNSKGLFQGLIHYDCFVTLIKTAFPALVCFLKSLEGEKTGYMYRFNLQASRLANSLPSSLTITTLGAIQSFMKLFCCKIKI